jgi:ferredoxin
MADQQEGHRIALNNAGRMRIAYDPRSSVGGVFGEASMSDATDRFTVEFVPSGLRYAARPDAAILQSAREAGLILPSSCRNGTCRSCICRMASGRVRYGIEWPGLSADEKAEGFILPCVALPESALVLEAARVLDLRTPGSPPAPA